MGLITLVTGGCRSGKSAFAQQEAEQLPGARMYLATSPRLDAEMGERIARHRRDRLNRGWQTVEEELDPARVIRETAAGTTILLDCLTLWVNNLLHVGSKDGLMSEDEVMRKSRELCDAAGRHEGAVFLVTNEVGLGIVPENSLARRYRDLVGRCNQETAARADRVFLVSCGLPLQLKG